MLQLCLGVAVAGAIVYFGWPLLGRGVALVAGGLAALASPSLFLESLLLADYLFGVMVLAGAGVLTAACLSTGGKRLVLLVLTGVVLAAACYVKPVGQALVVAPVLPLALATRSVGWTVGGTVLVAAVVVVCILPWMLRNEDRYGELTMSMQSGRTLVEPGVRGRQAADPHRPRGRAGGARAPTRGPRRSLVERALQHPLRARGDHAGGRRDVAPARAHGDPAPSAQLRRQHRARDAADVHRRRHGPGHGRRGLAARRALGGAYRRHSGRDVLRRPGAPRVEDPGGGRARRGPVARALRRPACAGCRRRRPRGVAFGGRRDGRAPRRPAALLRCAGAARLAARVDRARRRGAARRGGRARPSGARRGRPPSSGDR